MKSYVCAFSVDYSFDSRTDTTDNGFLMVDSFKDAFDQLVFIYGDDLTRVNEIELYDTSLLVDKDIYELIKSKLNSEV